jgi:hypothetical protein
MLHIGAALLLIPLALPWLMKLGFALLIVASLGIYLVQSGWIQVNTAVISLWPVLVAAVWDEHDQWLLDDNRQQTFRAQLLPTSFVHPQLAIINLRLEDQPWYKRYRSILLLGDNIDGDTFRRLRIRLRWYASQVPGNSVGPG